LTNKNESTVENIFMKKYSAFPFHLNFLSPESFLLTLEFSNNSSQKKKSPGFLQGFYEYRFPIEI
tara:strand:- start:663 stop:857 length:195 start_codon:yes stop_codon:yes gene_type:complete